MSGIFPAAGDGGVIVRDVDGNAVSAPMVPNLYVPPADFTMTAAMRLYGSDCTFAIWQMALFNAIVSELLGLAVAMDPAGTWDNARVDNLATAFGRWRDGLSSATDPREQFKFFARTSVDWNEAIQARLNGSPFDLTGATLHMVVINPADNSTVLTLNIGTGLTVTNAVNGEIAIHVAQSVMTTIMPGVYLHEMTVTHGGGLVDEVFNGTLTVYKGYS